MNAGDVAAWNVNWAWSLPLIVLSVVIHANGLGLINESLVRVLSVPIERRCLMPKFAGGHRRRCFVGYRKPRHRGGRLGHRLSASQRATGTKSGMLPFAQSNDKLRSRDPVWEERWQLIGTFEALNGKLLFGLATAFLFTMIQKVWPPEGRGGTRRFRVRFLNVKLTCARIIRLILKS